MDKQLLLFKSLTCLILLLIFFIILSDIGLVNPSIFLPTWDKSFVNGMWLEIIGGGIIAFLVWLISQWYAQRSDFAKTQQAVQDYFEDIVKLRLKRSFLRDTSAININLNKADGRNSQFNLDNSHINNLYNTINENIDAIYKYKEYTSSKDKLLIEKFINFKLAVENAYILSERIDNQLIRMGKLVKISSEDLKKRMLFYKATQIAEYDKQFVFEQLQEPYERLSIQENDNFVNSHFTNTKDKDRLKLLSELKKSVEKINDLRKKLKRDANEIKKLLYQDASQRQHIK